MFNVDFRFEEQQTTVGFPCDEEYLSVKFSELGVDDKLNTSQYMIGTDYYILSRLLTDYVDVDELNYLAKRLDSLNERELNTFEAVCEARVSRSVKDMINVTFNIYNYTLVQDLRSMESIGEAHFRAVHIGWKPEEAEKADFAKIGRELMKSGKGMITERGMLFEHECAQFINTYDGQNFPEYMYDSCIISAVLKRDGRAEYLYLPTQELAIDKALKRLGTYNINECSISLEDMEIDNLWFEKIQDIVEKESLYAANNVLGAVENAKINEELDKLEAVVEFAGRNDSASIIRLFDNLDHFMYFEGVTDTEELGRALIDDNEDYHIHEDISDFFMYEQYAEVIKDISDCKFCDNGAVLLVEMTLYEILREDDNKNDIVMGGM